MIFWLALGFVAGMVCQNLLNRVVGDQSFWVPPHIRMLLDDGQVGLVKLLMRSIPYVASPELPRELAVQLLEARLGVPQFIAAKLYEHASKKEQA